MQYKIPITSLPENLQLKYYSKVKNEAQLCLPKVQESENTPEIKHTRNKVKKAFGEFNADERELITFWTELIREWRIRRKEYESLAEGDMCFIAETKRLRKAYLAEHNISLNRDILYRKYKAYKENDLQALTENRGGWNKGVTRIPPQILECFTKQIMREDIILLFPILEGKGMSAEIDFLWKISQTQQAFRGAVNLFSNAYDNGRYDEQTDTSYTETKGDTSAVHALPRTSVCLLRKSLTRERSFVSWRNPFPKALQAV